MKHVIRASNWGYWDELDGEPLVDGERLAVRWPDGTLTAETCRVEKGVIHYSDHGHPGTGPDNKAFVVASFRGAEARIYLYGSGLLCERAQCANVATAATPACVGSAS